MIEFKKAVLLVYTSILFILHAYALGYVAIHRFYLNDFTYDTVFWFLTFITAAQYLDIFLSLFKFTKSNPFVVFIQVSGRILVLWVATHVADWNSVVLTLITVYLLSELCRGPYYISNCIETTPDPYLTWIRYNAFKVLYPIGFTCEFLCFVKVFLQSTGGAIEIDFKNKDFLSALLLPPFFFIIVWFLYTSMAEKAAKKNKELARHWKTE